MWPFRRLDGSKRPPKGHYGWFAHGFAASCALSAMYAAGELRALRERTIRDHDDAVASVRRILDRVDPPVSHAELQAAYDRVQKRKRAILRDDRGDWLRLADDQSFGETTRWRDVMRTTKPGVEDWVKDRVAVADRLFPGADPAHAKSTSPRIGIATDVCADALTPTGWQTLPAAESKPVVALAPAASTAEEPTVNMKKRWLW